MGKTMIHKQNFSDVLRECPFDFPTLLAKVNLYGGTVETKTEKELGLGNSHRQLRVFFKEELLEVCEKVIDNLKKLNNGRVYLGKWEGLLSYLEKEGLRKPSLGGQKPEARPTLLCIRVGGLLHEALMPKMENLSDISLTLHSVSGNDLVCLFRLDAPTQREIEEFRGDVTVTLFVKEHIPFLIFTFGTVYFETAIVDKNYVSSVDIIFYVLVDSCSNIVAAQGTLGIPQKFLQKIYNILDNTPHKTYQEASEMAASIRRYTTYEAMVSSGVSTKLHAPVPA